MSKHGNGAGTVTKLPSGSFRQQVQVAGRRHSVTGKSKKEVRQKARALLTSADRGYVPPVERLSVATHLERWLEDIAKPTVRPATHRSYSMLTRLYIVPALGNVKLIELQPAHLQKLYTALSARGLSASTVTRVHAVLRRSLRHAVDTGHLARNVSSAAHPPTPKGAELSVLAPEQVRALLAVAKGTRQEALLTVAVATGMRQGELLGLRWSDIDLQVGAIHVARQLGTDGTFSEPKTRQSRRTVDLPASTVAVLREHKSGQLQERLLLGTEYENGDLVFATHLGRPLGYRNVTRAFKGLLVKAGLPEVRFHDLRHTAATLLLLQGVPARVVQERLGHAQITLTLGTYSHVLPSMGRDAAARLDTLLA